MFLARLGKAFALVGIVGSTFGQDVHWTELELLDTGRPATAFKAEGLKTPRIPEEMSKLKEVAYGEVDFVADSTGAIFSQARNATSPWLKEAMEEVLRYAKVKSDPASEELRSGRATVAAYLLFNPATARSKLPESTPRLIRARSAVVPQSILSVLKKQKLSPSLLPRQAAAELEIGADGVPTNVTVADAPFAPGLRDVVAAALKEWRFEPARHEGQAVAGKVSAQVLINLPDRIDVSLTTKAPKPIRQVPPVYPMSERIGGFNGQVVVQFTVSKSGEVVDPVVMQTNNQAFDEPALEAVKKWKFEPGEVNGRAVNTRMLVPMVFQLNGNDSRDRYSVEQRNQNKLPPDLRNDFPPKVKNVASGVYPFEKLRNKERKTVKMTFAVSPTGRVVFTDRDGEALTDFEYAARAMLEEFEFVPASKDGKPNWGLLSMEVKFTPESESMPISESAERILRELKKPSPAIVTPKDLDQKVELVTSHKAVFPSNLLEKDQSGDATVEFFIDEKGEVQLPHVISAPHPSFGYAAVQAASKWRFKIPQRGGKPCIVRARTTLNFVAVKAPVGQEPGAGEEKKS